MKLYMFRAVLLPIIRSLFAVQSAMVYVIQVCIELSTRTRMDLELSNGMSYRFVDSFRAGAYASARKLSKNLYDICHC